MLPLGMGHPTCFAGRKQVRGGRWALQRDHSCSIVCWLGSLVKRPEHSQQPHGMFGRQAQVDALFWVMLSALAMQVHVISEGAPSSSSGQQE